MEAAKTAEKVFKTNGRKLEADKVDIEAKYAKVKNAAGAEQAEIKKAVDDAKKTAGVLAAKAKAMENGVKQTDLPKWLLKILPKILNVATVQTKASEDLAKSIVDEDSAISANLGDAYTAGATAVEKYVNEGVTWTELHIVLE